MSRVTLVQHPDQFPAEGREQAKPDLEELFTHLAGSIGQPTIPDSAKVFAIVARDPKLALMLIKLSDYMTREFPWTAKRKDLRQLMIQVINLHFKSDYNFQSHLASATRDGISPQMQAAIPYWETSSMFDEEQRLVIEYTLAAMRGDVSQDLFERLSAQFGELGAIEATVGAAWWAFWAVICSAIRPENDFGYGRSSTTGASAAA